MIISIVPVRIGSKSIKEKNIKDFCGRPLIYWTLKSLENSKTIDKVIVASDSIKINQIVNSFSFKKVNIYKRKSENSKDESSTESVLLEVLDEFNFNDKDIIYLNQATSPFTSSQDIDNAYKIYSNNDYDSLLTCSISKRFIWKKKGKPINYDFNHRPRRQDFEGTYIENGAFYINNVKNIRKHKNRLSGRIGLYEMDEYKSYEIDQESDWIICEKLFLNNVIAKEKNLSKIKLCATDVDGVLTDSGMYYSDVGENFKKFNTRDGMAFQILREKNIYSAIVTSEKSKIVTSRAKKLGVDFVGQGKFGLGKYDFINSICKELKISLDEVAYIGDDINCIELLKNVGFAACPIDAHKNVLSIKDIYVVNKKGGFGAFRSFVEYLLFERHS